MWHPKSILFGSDLFGLHGNLQILQLANLAMCQNRPLSLSVSLKHVKTVGDFVQTGVFFVAPKHQRRCLCRLQALFNITCRSYLWPKGLSHWAKFPWPTWRSRRLRALKLLTQTGRPVAERNWLGKEGKMKKNDGSWRFMAFFWIVIYSNPQKDRKSKFKTKISINKW